MPLAIHALILQRNEYGEADRMLTVFSLEQGRQRLIAKGVRRLLSTRKAALELFTHSTLLISDSPSLPNVAEASIIENFTGVKSALPRIITAHHIAEIVLKTTAEHDPQPDVYHLLAGTFRHLDREEEPRLTLEAFRLKYLEALGLAPELRSCVGCGKDIIAGEHWFSAKAEGIECPECRTPDAIPLSVNTLKLLRFFLAEDYATVGRMKLEPKDALAVRELTQQLVEMHVQKELKSTRFLE